MGSPAAAQQEVDAVALAADPAGVLNAVETAEAGLWDTAAAGLSTLNALVARAENVAGAGNDDLTKSKAALEDLATMLQANSGGAQWIVVRLATQAREVRKLIVQYVDPKLAPAVSLDQFASTLKLPAPIPLSAARSTDRPVPPAAAAHSPLVVQRPMDLPVIDTIPDPMPRIRSARTLTAVISGILIALIATATYAKTLVGTGPELLVIFFSAFALNIGADAVTGAAAKLPK
jgi:hypothetical protein